MLGFDTVWARRTGWLVLGTALFLTWSSVDSYASEHIFLVNRTESLPNWAFFMRRGGDAVEGDVVFFEPPKTKLVVDHFGAEPSPFGKIVYGVAGDEVRHDGEKVLVRRKGESDWRVVGSMKAVSMRGEVLKEGPVGVVPADCFYVGTPHKDGFDSRYAAIGFVCRKQLIGIAEESLL